DWSRGLGDVYKRQAQKYLLSHRSELKKRISENTLNKAVQLMGYEGRLTGHGIRGTISTALNEICLLYTSDAADDAS
ncbi:hypothetical protein ACM9NO_28905, partial [Pseudomonas paraeruginosa]